VKVSPKSRPLFEAAAIGVPVLAGVYLIAKLDALLALPDTATTEQIKGALGDAQTAKTLTLLSFGVGAGAALLAYKK